MALSSLRTVYVQKMVQLCSTTLTQRRPMAYKSSISLETLYPNSSLKLTTPSFSTDPQEKFSGYIPIEKLDVTYSASSGPGGQNVNKVHTKVDMRFKLSEADWLHPEVRERMLQLHGSKLSKEGYLIVRSDTTRSQQLNLADCVHKLRALLRTAAAAAAQRQPTPESQERVRQRHLRAARLRVAVKREDAALRALRRPPTVVDL